MIRLVLPGTTVEVRIIREDWYRLGTERVVSLELWADAACAECPVWFESETGNDITGWISLSLDGGATYTPAGITRATGVATGAFTADERKTVELKLAAGAGAGGHRPVITPCIGQGY